MVIASQLRSGMAIRFEGNTYKILAAEHHPGQGKMGGVTHAHMLNLDTGTFKDHGFRSDLKLEEVPLEKAPMEFLYRDGDNCVFMNVGTYEQAEIPTAMVGPQEKLLVDQMKVAVEFVDGRPVSVLFPDIMEVAVADTAPPVPHAHDNSGKEAVLENGLRIRVPQFIKSGDRIRLDVQKMEYMDRAK